MQVIFSLPAVFPITASNFNYVSRPLACTALPTQLCLARQATDDCCEVHATALKILVPCRPQLS